MKILYRALIILAAVALVIGATLAVTQLDSVQTLIASSGSEQHGERPQRGFRHAMNLDQAGTTQAVAASGDTAQATIDIQFTESASTAQVGAGVRPEGGGHSGNLLGISEVLKNLAIVVVITLFVAIPSWVIQKLQRGRRQQQLARAVVQS